MTESQRANPAEDLALCSGQRGPRAVAQVKGNDVMGVTFLGTCPFHHHETTDAVFLVHEGKVMLDVKDSATLGPGELWIVPKGMRHGPQRRTGRQGFIDQTDRLAEYRRPRNHHRPRPRPRHSETEDLAR